MSEKISKAEFQQFTKPQPGPHDKFMTGLGFSLQQTSRGVSLYKLTGSKEEMTPAGRSVRLISPLWITLTNISTMIVDTTDLQDVEPFDELRLIELAQTARSAHPEYMFPEIPAFYFDDDGCIFCEGIDWDDDEPKAPIEDYGLMGTR